MAAPTLTLTRTSGGPIDTGQICIWQALVRDSTGVLADAGAAPTVAVTQPDGTAITPAPTATKTATGTYDVPIITTQTGLHTVRVTGTGGGLGTGTDTAEDVFVVETSGTAFIGVDEASAQLRAAGIITSTADREQLRWLCLAACSAVEGDLGQAIAPRTVVETRDGGSTAILLRAGPVISVTTVTEDGTAVPSTGWVFSTSAGIIYRGTQQVQMPWLPGRQNVVLTLRVGYLVPPRIVRRVALGVVERAWQASQQAPHEAFDAAGAVTEVAAQLTGVERSAYDALRPVLVA